ncbi:YmfQ family protein [Clostridium sporogenes]|uniref:YmfQ family protein n=1 Tax=Clostridium sporogenes TaxID=1509 RepID=UPI0039E13101
MITYVSPIYEQSRVMQAIFEAIGYEWDVAEGLSHDMLKQFFPQTATWGLIYWEEAVSIVTNLTEGIERRRRKVIAKLQSRYAINPKRMALILKNYTGADVLITENIAPYTFEVKLTGREGFPKSLEDLYKEVKRIKPSHLAVRYKLISITQSKFYVGAATLCGEEIVVYPWSPKEIESKGKVNVAITNNTGVEKITLYPKKEG